MFFTETGCISFYGIFWTTVKWSCKRSWTIVRWFIGILKLMQKWYKNEASHSINNSQVQSIYIYIYIYIWNNRIILPRKYVTVPSWDRSGFRNGSQLLKIDPSARESLNPWHVVSCEHPNIAWNTLLYPILPPRLTPLTLWHAFPSSLMYSSEKWLM